MHATTRLLAAAVTLMLAHGSAYAQSPYAGQETREIKALSPQDVANLMAGKGMGFAKPAELNGIPGPAHVLELAAELGLTAEQRSGTEALFRKMQTQAVTAGRQLIEEERVLDHQFFSRSVTPESLRSLLARIAALRSELRRVHLQAHLEQVKLLTHAQVAAYSDLRGYGGVAHPGHAAH